MAPTTDNKIILITRKTRLDELIARFNTLEQARFYIEHSGADFDDYLNEHEQYALAVRTATAHLKTWGQVQALDRYFLPNFVFGPRDMVIVLGQDGLVANTMKYLDGQPVIGVNPEPGRWDGILLPFTVEDLAMIVPEALTRKRAIQEVSMAKATLNDGQVLYGVNDLFIGPRSHTSIRYTIQVGKVRENHSSSGIIVSTGLGSTGWLKSLVTGAQGIVQALAGKEIQMQNPTGFAWEADSLYFTVREPFPSRTSTTDLVFGQITGQNTLLLESKMPEDGVIFSDGIESDFVAFNSGSQAVIGLAEKKGVMVV
ncbi:MAG: sugar kinase [Thermodesulfobacteriota bacterium]